MHVVSSNDHVWPFGRRGDQNFKKIGHMVYGWLVISEYKSTYVFIGKATCSFNKNESAFQSGTTSWILEIRIIRLHSVSSISNRQ